MNGAIAQASIRSMCVKKLRQFTTPARPAEEFVANLHKAGYVLTKGDNDSYVLVDKAGDIHGLMRRIEGAKLKDLRQKFPDLKDIQLPSLASRPERTEASYLSTGNRQEKRNHYSYDPLRVWAAGKPTLMFRMRRAVSRRLFISR